MSEHTRNCEWILERLDAFVDDDLDANERDAVVAHCAGCDGCAREMEMARRIRDELRAFPALAAPAHLIDAAERATREEARGNVVPLRSQRATGALRRVVVVAAAVTLFGAAVWLGVRGQAPHEPEVSEADVRRASAEVALAFGYVDHYSNDAAAIVRDDVIGKRVMPRIERALGVPGDAAVHDAIVPGLKKAERGVTSPPPDRS